MEKAALEDRLYAYLRSDADAATQAQVPETLPDDAAARERLLHGLMNVRPAHAIPADVLAVQDAYLQLLNEEEAPAVTLDALSPVAPQLYLFQGDIRRLAVDAIVNAANSKLLGCFLPNHLCIDNVIQTQAGMQMRWDLKQRMEAAGKRYEPIGKVTVTPGYNLRARYVFHTVGPSIAPGKAVTPLREELLANCYRSCLTEAARRGLDSLAFCCISTGEFAFPQERAAEIAVGTARDFLAQTDQSLAVIFNVFKDSDRAIYERLLGVTEAE